MANHAPVFFFAKDAWNNYWQTRHHIVYRLAQRGWPVYYTRNIFSHWDIGSEAWEHSTWRIKREQIDGIRFHWPGRLYTHLAGVRNWARFLRSRQIAGMLKDIPEAADCRRIAYLFHPSFADYLEFLDGFKVVYHADDTFSAMPGWNDVLAQQERTLVERADLVIAASRLMAKHLPLSDRKPAVVIPNGADTRAFCNADKAPMPTILNGIPSPRIGYMGTINDKVDLGLIARIARARTDWHWCIAGHIVPQQYFSDGNWQALEQCRKLENVHFLGALSCQQLPCLVRHMDVNTLAYRTTGDGWWKNIYPLKLHEYLATGKPVVSAELDSVAEFNTVVEIVSSPEAWTSALDRAISGYGVGDPASRRRVALANDWSERIDRIDALLSSTLSH